MSCYSWTTHLQVNQSKCENRIIEFRLTVTFTLHRTNQLFSDIHRARISHKMYHSTKEWKISARRPISMASQQRSSAQTFIKRSFSACFRSTQTHGYKFLVSHHRSQYETLFWILALCTVSTCTIWMILIQYVPLLNRPTETTQLPTQKSVKHVPFPTIGFCSSNRISREALQNLSDFV